MITADELIGRFYYAMENGWGYIFGKCGQVWTKAEQKAATKEMTVKYGSRWIGHHVADCSGLFTWAFKQLGGYMYHGSNTMYKSYCTRKGTLPVDNLKPGTAVFTGTENDHGHVGLYVGGGMVIEAKGTQYGVIVGSINDKLKNGGRRWTYWGELKGVEYAGGGDEPMPDIRPTLRRGDKGEYVTRLQTQLIQFGYDVGPKGADGVYGSATEAAVKAFQKDRGLTVDGVCGPKTYEALENGNTEMYSVTVPHMTLTQAEELQKQYPAGIITKE